MNLQHYRLEHRFPQAAVLRRRMSSSKKTPIEVIFSEIVKRDMTREERRILLPRPRPRPARNSR